MDQKIMALIVTYNRKDFLLELLNALSDQVRKPDRILIIDNHSSDHTAEYLADKGIIQSSQELTITKSFWNHMEILYYRNNQNTGGAGGFHTGIKFALSMNNDFLWLMDDDVVPQKDCLSKLLEKISEECGVCIPNRTTGTFHDCPVKSFIWNDYRFLAAEKIYEEDYEASDCIEVCDMPFEGPLIRYDILQKVGLSDDQYFIFYDDSDYAQRCLKHTKILFVTNARLNKQILPNEYKKKFSWRDYYMYRNDFIFDKNYNPNKATPYIRAFFQCIHGIAQRWKMKDAIACKYIFKAYFDGIRNKRGKTVEPGSF